MRILFSRRCDYITILSITNLLHNKTYICTHKCTGLNHNQPDFIIVSLKNRLHSLHTFQVSEAKYQKENIPPWSLRPEGIFTGIQRLARRLDQTRRLLQEFKDQHIPYVRSSTGMNTSGTKQYQFRWEFTSRAEGGFNLLH